MSKVTEIKIESCDYHRFEVGDMFTTLNHDEVRMIVRIDNGQKYGQYGALNATTGYIRNKSDSINRLLAHYDNPTFLTRLKITV